MFYDLLTELLIRMDEAEYLSGNNTVSLNLPVSMPDDWNNYKLTLGQNVENLSPLKNLVITELPHSFDNLTIFKIEQMVSLIESRFSKLP